MATDGLDPVPLCRRCHHHYCIVRSLITSDADQFVPHAVQKVMLVGCDWWFSNRIVMHLRNLHLTNEANLHRYKF